MNKGENFEPIIRLFKYLGNGLGKADVHEVKT